MADDYIRTLTTWDGSSVPDISESATAGLDSASSRTERAARALLALALGDFTLARHFVDPRSHGESLHTNPVEIIAVGLLLVWEGDVARFGEIEASVQQLLARDEPLMLFHIQLVRTLAALRRRTFGAFCEEFLRILDLAEQHDLKSTYTAMVLENIAFDVTLCDDLRFERWINRSEVQKRLIECAANADVGILLAAHLEVSDPSADGPNEGLPSFEPPRGHVACVCHWDVMARIARKKTDNPAATTYLGLLLKAAQRTGNSFYSDLVTLKIYSAEQVTKTLNSTEEQVSSICRRAKHFQHDWLEAQALLRRSTLLQDQGRNQEATNDALRACDLFDHIEDHAGQAHCLHQLANLAVGTRQWTQAIDICAKALPLFDELGDKVGYAGCLISLGNAHIGILKFETALEHHREALSLFRDCRQNALIPVALNGIAQAYQRMGDPSRALGYFEEALVASEASGNLRVLGKTCLNLSTLVAATQSNDKALEYLAQAQAVFAEIVDRPSLARCYLAESRILLDKGHHGQALERASRAADLFEQTRERKNLSLTFQLLGFCAEDSGDYTLALTYILRAISIAEELNDMRNLALFTSDYARMLVNQGRLGEAVEILLRSLGVAEQFGPANVACYAEISLAHIYYRMNDWQKALEQFGRAYHRAAGPEFSRERLTLAIEMVHFFTDLDDYSNAENFLQEGLRLAEQVSLAYGRLALLSAQSALEAKRGRFDRAFYCANTMLDEARRLDQPDKQLLAHLALADLYKQTTEWPLAHQSARTALDLARHIGDRTNALKSKVLLLESSLSDTESSEQKVNLAKDLANLCTELKEMSLNRDLEVATSVLERASIECGDYHLAWHALETRLSVQHLRQGEQANTAAGKYRIRVMRDAEESKAQQRSNAQRTLIAASLPASIASSDTDDFSDFNRLYTGVGILFADIKGFTVLSTRVDTLTLVVWLKELFTKFDRLCARHKVEKIKTTGDSFMACSGAPDEEIAPCQKIAALALDMIGVARATTYPDGSKQGLEIRIGVHYGDVVGAVIGQSRMHFEVVGQEVKRASLLEARSESNRIHASAAFVQHCDGYVFEPRSGQSYPETNHEITYWLQSKT